MIEIIPSIDLMQGKCVRLQQGRFDRQTEYSTDPIDLARLYMEKGFKRLHVVDLEGAKEKRLMHLETLSRMCQNTNLVIDYGGGIRSARDVDDVLNAGAGYVTVGSLAVREPVTIRQWMKGFGPEKFILAADVRNGKVTADAWTSGPDVHVEDLIGEFLPAGLEWVLCTDISRDGMLEGVNMDLYHDLKSKFTGLHVIASGGVTSIEDLKQLDRYHVDAAVIGKAIYEGRIDLNELK